MFVDSTGTIAVLDGFVKAPDSNESSTLSSVVVALDTVQAVRTTHSTKPNVTLLLANGWEVCTTLVDATPIVDALQEIVRKRNGRTLD